MKDGAIGACGQETRSDAAPRCLRRLGFGRPGGLEHSLRNQGAKLANCDFPAIDNKQKKQGLANHIAAPEMKNPGALAGATGEHSIAFDGAGEDYLIRTSRATALRALIDRCDPSDAALILSDALERMRLGAPIPPLMSAMDEARSWAEWATPFELKAYCLACYNAMPPKDQAGFLAYVTGGM